MYLVISISVIRDEDNTYDLKKDWQPHHAVEAMAKKYLQLNGNWWDNKSNSNSHSTVPLIHWQKNRQRANENVENQFFQKWQSNNSWIVEKATTGDDDNEGKRKKEKCDSDVDREKGTKVGNRLFRTFSEPKEAGYGKNSKANQNTQAPRSIQKSAWIKSFTRSRSFSLSLSLFSLPRCWRQIFTRCMISFRRICPQLFGGKRECSARILFSMPTWISQYFLAIYAGNFFVLVTEERKLSRARCGTCMHAHRC